MKSFTQRIAVRMHDHKLQRDLKRDEEGLTMLAYALGAAVIIVPLAGLVLAFGKAAVNEAGSQVNNAL
jgi:Flp pilus assembly pilin Flp